MDVAKICRNIIRVDVKTSNTSGGVVHSAMIVYSWYVSRHSPLQDPLANLCNGWSWSGNPIGINNWCWDIGAVDNDAGAVLGDVAWLTTLVASLPCGVQWSTIWSSAVTRNMTLEQTSASSSKNKVGSTYQFTTCITLHSLRLAISSVMVGTTTLVADGSTVVLNTIIAASEPTTATSWGNVACIWSRAVSCEMAYLATSVAAASLGTTDSQSWAVSLDVTKSLTVVTLFGFQRCISMRSSFYCVSCSNSLSVVRGIVHWLDSCPGCLQL